MVKLFHTDGLIGKRYFFWLLQDRLFFGLYSGLQIYVGRVWKPELGEYSCLN